MVITGSVSLSPIVVALSVAENHVQQRNVTKLLTDQAKKKAELASKTVTKVKPTSKKSGINSRGERSVDFRA
jgi:hypothetical protein